MMETLMNLIRQQSGDAVINNPAIPNHQNEDALQAISSGILGGLQQQAQGGNLSDLLSMVTGQGSVHQSPVTQGVQQNVQQNLMERLGISPQVAMSIATMVVPMVLSKLMSKSQDPNDSSVDGNQILGAATGNQGVDWMGAASSAMADGKLDMNDLMRVAGGFMGGGNNTQQNNQQNQSNSGGLGGLLGGLFGN